MEIVRVNWGYLMAFRRKREAMGCLIEINDTIRARKIE